VLLSKERKMIVDYGKKMTESELTTGTGGNISIYSPKKKLVAISPSGLNYHDITLKDVVIMDLEGKIIEGKYTPSSEFGMHLIMYQKRDDVRAVIHTHSIYATTIASLNWEIPSVHYLVAFAGMKVPCARYASFGTKQLAKNAYNAMGSEYNAVLLANHGLLAVGNNIETAFATAEEIEFSAEVYYRTKAIGEPRILSEKEMEFMIEKFKTYGQK